jgi:hypothetical protein
MTAAFIFAGLVIVVELEATIAALSGSPVILLVLVNLQI